MKQIEAARGAASAALDRALGANITLVDAYLRRARGSRADATPAQVLASLDKQYLAAVATLGGAGGASAAVPGLTTPLAVTLNVTEIASFFEASTLYALAVAAVHGQPVHDIARRRTLVMALLLGNSGETVVRKIAGRTGPHWARGLVRSIPMRTIDQVNRVLGQNFVTKYGTRQGILVLGRMIPLGVGAAIGAAGNYALGRATVQAARRAFGDPPTQWRVATPSTPTPRPVVIDGDFDVTPLPTEGSGNAALPGDPRP